MILASITAIISLIALWFMPKRLKPQEIYITWGMVSLIAFTLDGYLGSALDLYYFFNERNEVRDIICQLVIPGPIGVIVLNFMPKRMGKFLLYSIIVTFLATVFEWFASQTDYLNYIRWQPGTLHLFIF